MTNRTLPARGDRVAALYRLAPLATWEAPYEEIYLALFTAVRAGLDARGCWEAVWARAHQLACRTAEMHLGPYLSPIDATSPLDYATERAGRIWALITADRTADRWVSLDPEAGLEDW